MVAHVVRHAVIDLAGELVPKRFWIAVLAHWAVGRLPDFQLLAGAPVAAQRRLEPAHLRHGHFHLTFVRPLQGPRGLEPGMTRLKEGIIIIVYICELIMLEADGIGVKGPGATKKVRVVKLEREGLPATRRAAR